MSAEELRTALENITKAHAGALARAEAAEKRGRGLQEELAATKQAAAAAASNVAAAVASVRGSGRADAGGVGGASFGVFAFDENAVDVKRAELAKIEGKVTVAKERLRATEEAALAAAAAAATTRTPTSNGGSRELPGASLPTPRTRARTALRLSRGPAPVATEKSPDAGGDARRRSPGSKSEDAPSPWVSARARSRRSGARRRRWRAARAPVRDELAVRGIRGRGRAASRARRRFYSHVGWYV